MTNFTPSKVRITGIVPEGGEGGPPACEVRSWHISGVGNVIGNFTGATGEVVVDLTYGVGEYFGRIVANGYTSISKIEFNEDPGPEPWYDVTYQDINPYWNSAGTGWSWDSLENEWVKSEGSGLLTADSSKAWPLPYVTTGTYHFWPTKMRITGTVVGSEAVTLKTNTGDTTIGSASPLSVTTLNLNNYPTEGQGTALIIGALDLTAFSFITKIEMNFPIALTTAA